jgi:iron complex transport system ATP-binding protein
MTVLSAEIELYQRSGIRILSGIRWDVEQGQHWILLGPNGSGKSSLVKLLTLYEWPTTGTIRIEDQVVGEFTMVELRKRIGLFEPNLQSEIGHHYPWVTAEEIVLTGKSGGLMLFGAPSEADLARARSMLAQESFDPGRTFCVMSSGEQRRTLLLRCLFSRPAVVILDEPYESLDIKARWSLENSLIRFMEQPATTSITAMHRLDEIPPRTTHACLLRQGTVMASGPIETVLTSENASALYEVPIALSRINGRFFYERA